MVHTWGVQTGMIALLYLLAGVGALALLSTLVFALLCWIGRGSPDVNGDPERDSGCPSGTPVIVCSWCHSALDADKRRVPTTHGLCLDCVPRVERENGLEAGSLTGCSPTSS